MLTAKQREIVTLIGQGLSNKQIAQKIFVSQDTVKDHVSRLCQKFECSNRTQLAVFAHQNNLINQP